MYFLDNALRTIPLVDTAVDQILRGFMKMKMKKKTFFISHTLQDTDTCMYVCTALNIVVHMYILYVHT